MKFVGYRQLRGYGVVVLLIGSLCLSSCGGGKKRTRVKVTTTKKTKAVKRTSKTKVVTKTTTSPPPKKRKKRETKVRQNVLDIVAYAKSFQGTRYQYGGTTKRGMDCSGLVYTAFQKEAIALPRTSRAMATKGVEISLKKVTVGDLLFFKTARVKKHINHVGIVVEVSDEIRFIHASVSKGVTISSLNEKYWNRCYAKAKRIL